MANKQSEIIAAEMMIIPLVLLFIIDITNHDYRHIEKNSTFYIISTTICTLIYIAIFYLHTKRIVTQKWKGLIAMVSLLALMAILPLRFILHPPRLDFEFLLLFGIDVVATVVLLLLNFIKDTSNTILVSIFATILVLLFIDLADHHRQQYNYIVTVTILTGAYLIIFWLYVKHIPNRGWKVTATALFIFAIVVVIVLYCVHVFTGIKFIFNVLVGIDAFSAFVLWLWMYAPRVKEWQNVYTEQVVYQNDQCNFLQTAGLPSRFALNELNKATSNFQTPIGEGGSGAIFKGIMEDGSIVAVKRIKGQPSGEVEFRTEITIIASLQHVNLVRLLGYCLSPRGDRYLIYPFFENGSLDSWIFAQEEKRSNLTWVVRYNIAIAVAKALAYLHNECHLRILHLDVKPANILLDGDFKALVSDFGISKSIGRDESSVMTRARGTVGYLAPEMLVPNAISTKSDVYSYGMVLLELFGGRKNFQSTIDEQTRQRRNSYLPKIVREKMVEGKLMEVVDESLLKNDKDMKEDQVTVLVQVALWCIQENPELRPTTTEAVDMLEGRKAVQIPPESPMFVVNFLDVESRSSISREAQAQADENDQLSNNTISISIQSGR
ncbi:hypothetical protein LUZ60_000606 [Juncus effusus]|nr:hypothetical protein LUZ60_000606 [Juncus effusus]